MSLSKEDILHIAHLARLHIGDDETAGVADKLSRIIGLVDQLQDADTGGVEPMSHPLNMQQRLRPDEVTETDHRDEYQRNAAAVSGGLYRVPRVIE